MINDEATFKEKKKTASLPFALKCIYIVPVKVVELMGRYSLVSEFSAQLYKSAVVWVSMVYG